MLLCDVYGQELNPLREYWPLSDVEPKHSIRELMVDSAARTVGNLLYSCNNRNLLFAVLTACLVFS